VGGDGKIVTAEVSAEAGKGTSFETAPVSTTGDGKGDVQFPSSGNSTGGTGGGGNYSGGGNTTVNVMSIAPITATADHNATYTLPAEVSAALSSGGTRDFAVIWEPDTADTSVCGRFEYEGTLTMVEGYENPNIVKAKLTLTVVPVLTSIEVSQLPAKTLYTVGEELDITGLAVTGTYSDTSTAPLAVTVGNITGFDSETAGEQTLTVDIDGKTDTFDVTVYAAVESGNLVSITAPAAVSVANGTALNLPPRVEIVLEGDSTALADVEWDVEGSDYDPETKTVQTFTVDGDVTLPEGIENTDDVSLTVQISVTVEAAKYTVSFNLNGQTGASIPSQTIEHGANAVEPEEPESTSHDFIGWYTEEEAAWEFESDTVTEDTVLYAKWQIKTYIISFGVGDAEWETAELPDDIEAVEHGTAAAQPTDPILAGYAFAGWYTDSELEAAYNWSAPVTKNFTLYAKFADTLTLAADALTFELISNANTNEQNIKTNLALLAGMDDYPGVTITWSSSNTEVISNTGTVMRPEDSDAEVALTATLTLETATKTKVFNLHVHMKGIADVVVESTDERFAPGYPKISIGNDGKPTITIKLDSGVASYGLPVIAYLSLCGTSYDITFDKEAVIFNHTIPVPDYIGYSQGYNGWAIRPGEIAIIDDAEYSFQFDSRIGANNYGTVPVFGIVLLAGDDIADDQASATVIKLTYEEMELVDTAPPQIDGAILNSAKDKLYLEVLDSVALTTENMPSASDFSLSSMGDVNIIGVSLIESVYSSSNQLLEFALSGAASPSYDYAKITYTPSDHPLTDASGNSVTSPLDAYITSANHDTNLYVNPAAGTAMLTFEPAIGRTGAYYGFTDISSHITIKYKGNSVGSLTYSNVVQMGYGVKSDKLGFTFAPINDGEVNANDFTFSIDGEVIDVACEPYNTSDKPAAQILSIAGFDAASITAVYDGSYTSGYSGDKPSTAGIVVSFPSNCVINFDNTSLKALACEFTLTVDGKRIAYRYLPDVLSGGGNENKIVLPLSARINALVQTADSVTLSYTPTIHDTDNVLIDITGAYLPAFGPVEVTVSGG
jgi:uncharacterized repeat protein (TIGR02543 family)